MLRQFGSGSFLEEKLVAEAVGLEGEAEAEHVLEEDIGDGAVQLVLVVAVVVTGDQVEPIRLASWPEGDFGVEVGRDVSFEEGSHGS